MFIKGYNVYGYLKVEKGVYWLVWIFLFDLLGCCYILFVLCDVILDFNNDEIEIEINLDDIIVDIFRVFGVGG